MTTAQPPQDAIRWSRFLPLLLVLLGVMAYANSLHGAFVFDDESEILERTSIRRLWPLSAHFQDTRRPILQLSLALNHALGGDQPMGYHLFNLAAHILAGLTLMGVVRRTLELPQWRERFAGRAPWWAMSIAALWLLHPLNTQAVSYVIQRAESLMGLLYLLTLYCSIRAWQSRRGLLWSLAAALSCALGMGVKEVMVTAPVMVVLYDHVFGQGSWPGILRRRWPLYVMLAATWIVLWKLLGAGQALHTDPSAGFAVPLASPFTYLMSQTGVILHYLRLAFWPHPLILDYLWLPAQSVREVALPLALVGGLLLATLAALWFRLWLGYLGAWFFLILSPTSSLVPIVDLVMEHRMYLPLIAVVAAVVFAGHAVLSRWFGPRAGMVGGAMVVILALSLGLTTIARNRDYHSEISLWQSVVRHRPGNPRGHYNLGIALKRAGEFEAAKAAMQEAIRLQPRLADPYVVLGELWLELGRPDQASAALQRAVQLAPQEARAHYHLGRALALNEQLDAAAVEFQNTIDLNPDDFMARHQLALLWARRGDWRRAIDLWQFLAARHPEAADFHANLGVALQRAGQTREGLEHLRRAERLEPGEERVLLLLAVGLVRAGQVEEARQIPGRIPEGQERLEFLQALAAALAHENYFDPAVLFQQQAVDHAQRLEAPPALLQALRQRLDQYRAPHLPQQP